MIRVINFLHAAETEAADAIDWYEDKQAGLGAEFRVTLENAIVAVQDNPFAFQIVFGTAVRRVLTHRFPYSIIYTVDDDTILVIAVFHSSRNPIIWRGRI